MSREMFGMVDLYPLSQPQLLVGQLSHLQESSPILEIKKEHLLEEATPPSPCFPL